MTKKELEEAVQDGRVEAYPFFGDNPLSNVSHDNLIEILLKDKEFICEDSEHYGEHDVHFSQVFEIESKLDVELSAKRDEESI